MLKFFNADQKNSLKKLEEILNSRKIKQKIQTSKVRQIILSVKKNGDNALINCEKKFSNIKTKTKVGIYFTHNFYLDSLYSHAVANCPFSSRNGIYFN